MRRLMVQDAFVGEPNPNQEGLAALGQGDEVVTLRIEGGQLVLLVSPGTTDENLFETAQFLGFDVNLEDGRTLSFGAQGDAEGTYMLVGRRPRGVASPTDIPLDLSTVWAVQS